MKTVHVIITDSVTRVVMDEPTASILQSFIKLGFQKANMQECSCFSGMEIKNASYSDETRTFSGTIQLSEYDTMDFNGKYYYDGDRPVIDEIDYFTPDLCISEHTFKTPDQKHLREFISEALYERFNPEMYAQWSREQEDGHQQLLEDERMGN